MGDSLLESGCEFCGACIDVCPVGALTETANKWERAARTEQSVCGECPVGCTMTSEVNHWERMVRAVPELNAPTNHGQACFQGKFGFEYVNDKLASGNRWLRRDGELQEASWDEAIAVAARGWPRKGRALRADGRTHQYERGAVRRSEVRASGDGDEQRRCCLERSSWHRGRLAGRLRLLRRRHQHLGPRKLFYGDGGEREPH